MHFFFQSQKPFTQLRTERKLTLEKKVHFGKIPKNSGMHFFFQSQKPFTQLLTERKLTLEKKADG